MCGICAMVAFDNNRIPVSMMRDSLLSIGHRGPDDSGVSAHLVSEHYCEKLNEESDAEVILGHRRLSIIDLSEYGHQPMTFPGIDCVLTFNGEIYNYIEIRAQLEQVGIQFHSETDSEVLLQAYKWWGEKCLNKLKGMFAFIILDQRLKRLFVARDYFGIKPLYYSISKQGLFFASETKVLANQFGNSPVADLNVVHQFLYNGRTEHSKDTFFRDIKTFPSASYAIVDLSDRKNFEINPVRYWSPTFGGFSGSFDEATGRVRELLESSVKIHLRSDVQLGANISGGLDSSSVVNFASRMLENSDVQLFTYSSDDKQKNEDKWVKAACQSVPWKINRVSLEWQDLAQQLDDIVYSQDYPFASLSMYAENQIYKQASEMGIKVMVGGQGADEYFGGYSRYLSARVTSLLLQGKYAESVRFLRSSAAFNAVSVNSILMFVAHHLLPHQANLFVRSLVGKQLFPEWMDASYFSSRGVGQLPNIKYQSKTRLSEQLWLDSTQGGLQHHLRSEDRSSMQYSIESRVPFLENELVEFVLSLPENYLISDKGETKSVLRSAISDIVPDSIVRRRDKIGFETGEKNWVPVLREALEIEFRGLGESVPFLLPKQMLLLLQQSISNPGAHGEVLWRVFNLAKWVKAYDIKFE